MENNSKYEYYKKTFDQLPESLKEYLLYRVIIDVGLKIDNVNGYEMITYENDIESNDLYDMIKAAKVGFAKPYTVYGRRGIDTEFQKIYIESIQHYTQVLNAYKKLAQELNITSSIDLSNLFTFMLWNGYYSVSKKHSYHTKDRLLLPGLYGFDVIKGSGVCLNYADLLKNYLTVCGRKSTLLNCYVKPGEIKLDYSPAIERNNSDKKHPKFITDTKSLLVRGITRKFGNHSIILIKDDSYFYAYDPTNLCALRLEDENSASIINGNGSFKIKPIATLFLMPHCDHYNLYESLIIDKEKPSIPKKDLILSFEKVIELLKSNKPLLDDAYDSIHSDLEFIDNQTNEIGNYKQVLRMIKERNKDN